MIFTEAELRTNKIGMKIFGTNNVAKDDAELVKYISNPLQLMETFKENKLDWHRDINGHVIYFGYNYFPPSLVTKVRIGDCFE